MLSKFSTSTQCHFLLGITINNFRTPNFFCSILLPNSLFSFQFLYKLSLYSSIVAVDKTEIVFLSKSELSGHGSGITRHLIMRGKANQDQEDDEYEDEDFASRKDGPSSNITTTSANNNTNINNNKDVKNSGKANATRSKHSVTEQRRRSKINERFQILRELIPHGDQKRDTASFLLEVIEYVQYLQEKVQKYEGSYQGWGSEPAKLMPWRNSHWRVQSFVGHQQAMKTGSGPGSAFPGRFDESNIPISPSMLTNMQNPLESDPSKEATCKEIERQPEFANKGMPVTMPVQTEVPASIQSVDITPHHLHHPVSDAQSDECPMNNDPLNQQEVLTIEGGTISISSVYSEGLLNNLTQALQSAGVDLSQSKISVQIDLGKRANRGLSFGTSTARDLQNLTPGNQAAHLGNLSSGEDLDQAQKRLKTQD
ncbi:hypothetical protein K2173_015117 [Erythroxylum novogranatense]|uniref:BHLH domain-containing protein n=1 Tax=Erythroxylum novogranatense TaxID=1862640 RepID=A0AAV8T110_9ROSI|nr:hypothetical protein K2173_015117 [Erythroxylum novogranatense]